MEQCVMINGTMKMPPLSALNLDSLAMVSSRRTKCYICVTFTTDNASIHIYTHRSTKSDT